MQGFSPRWPRLWLIAFMIGLIGLNSGCTLASDPPMIPATPVLETFSPTTLAALVPTATALPAPTATAVPTPTVRPSPSPVVLSTATSVPTPVVESIDPTLATNLQRILDQLVADGSIPGAVLAVHIPGAEPWVGASGYRDRQAATPMQTNTRIRIASISKIFTAVVIMQLVEEGRISLDTPVSTWFPELVPNGDRTTVRRLLNHTTGLYDYLEDKDFLAQAYRRPNYTWIPAELVRHAAQQRSAFAPGTPGAWDYSSTNYVILGMIVEKVTSNSMATEVRRRILEPLDLQETFFAPEEAVDGVQARGYRWTFDQTNISLSFAFSTANIVSTVSDIQRFGDGLFGGRLLKPETFEQMLAFENGKGQYNMPSLEYGLGIMRNRLPVGRDARGATRPIDISRVLGHTGGFGGFRTVLWHAPESGITIALGMNQGATDPNILATRTFQAILTSQGR